MIEADTAKKEIPAEPATSPPGKSTVFTSTPCASKYSTVTDFKRFAIADCSGFESDDSLFQDSVHLKALEEKIVALESTSSKERAKPNENGGSTPKRLCTDQNTPKRYMPSNNVNSHTSPALRQNRSLISQINQRLKQNSLKNSESAGNSTAIRALCRQKVLDEAQVIQNQISQSDIGPFYGLPQKVKFLFKTFRGIDALYDWQDECLKLPVISQRKNLIYTLPTSGGKTLVAEILMLRELLCHEKDVIFVLPYVSLVQEKLRGLAPFAVELDFVVAEYASSKGTLPPRKRRHRHTLYVCTFEKANMLVNSLIEAKRLNEIGLIVADELHMIGEKGGRGAVFESLLAKVLYMRNDIQVVGMSATLSNMGDLKKFLHAEVYEKNFRPVELREFVKVGNELFEFGMKKNEIPTYVRDVKFDYYTSEMIKKDPDKIAGLVMEVIPQNSCLIFCPTKKHCENVALMLSEVLPQEQIEYKKEEKLVLYNALASEGDGHLCRVLARTVKFGVAYHHSGLTSDERKLIEEAYAAGALCCLCCTSTLAAGVNLPAKRVILRAPYIGRDFLSFSRYKQMIGRAGRAGIDSSGESILMIKSGEEAKVHVLLSSDVDACQSSLLLEPCRIQILLLSLVGIGIVSSLEEIQDFMRHTLASAQCQDNLEMSTVCKETIQLLREWGLVRDKTDDETKLVATKLGMAAFKGGVEASRAQELFSTMKKGLAAVALNSYLHLLFMVTPVEFIQQIRFDPAICFRRYMELSAEDQEVAKLIGISEATIMIAVSGRSLSRERQELLHHFYITLMLYDLWERKLIWSVAENFDIHRGIVQNLLATSSGFGSTMVYFCEEFDIFWAYQALLPSFVKQLAYCVTSDLLPLMELPAVKIGRARQLHSAGFKSVADIARTNPSELVSRISHLPYRAATQIISAAKMMLIEKIEALQDEAELLRVDDLHCSVIFDSQDVAF